MMEKSEEVFLQAYTCALKKKSFEKHLSPAEYRQVFSLADSHFVYPMIFESIYPSLSEEEKRSSFFEKGLKKAERITTGQARMTAEFLKLYRFLNRKGLFPLVVKGIISRDLYQDPEQRPSSDEDLLIEEKDFSAYHEAFLEYGLHLADEDQDIEEAHEVSYCGEYIFIELHKKLFPPESKAYGNLNQYFNDVGRSSLSVYGVEVYIPDHTSHLFYQLCHAYKHFLNCGIGIRLVSDIVLYSIRHLQQIDWDSVLEDCREIKAYDFVRALYAIGERHLFKEDYPAELKEIWNTEDIEELPLLEDILKGGLYGTSSKDRLHSSNLTLYAAQEASKGHSSGLLHALFPPLSSLKGRYPYLRKYPFLLPVSWLQRLFHYLLNNKKGDTASEAVRIGNERVALMERYRIIEEKKKEGSIFKRIYKWSHKSFLAPVLSPLYTLISMSEYHILNLLQTFRRYKKPNREEQELVRENMTFLFKSFERQPLARSLVRNIHSYYPGAHILIADDSHEPLTVDDEDTEVISLPFNSGLSAGLDKALKEVKTPYVMRMDDDELLMNASMVHRELKYLMDHEELDLIGLGHTTAIRLHPPSFNFKEYYKSSMEDALRPLKIPHKTEIDEKHIVLGKVANIYLARTEKLREVGFDPNIRVIDHHEFFFRAAGIIVSAAALDTVVFHRHNPYDRQYNNYRSDFMSDLEYIKRKRRKMTEEARNEHKQ